MTKRSLAGARRNSAVAVIDQGLVSLSSLVYTVLVARESSLHGFGSFALINGYYFLALSINRAVVAVPVTLAAGTDTPETSRTEAMAVAPAVGLALSLPFAMFAWIASDDSWRLVAICTGLLLPVACVQDVGRYSLISMRRAGAAAVSDGAWLLTQVLVVLALYGTSGPIWATVGWLLGGLVAMLITSRALGPARSSLRHALRAFVRDRGRRLALAGEAVVNMGSGYAAMAIIAAHALSTAGALRAGMTVLAPASVLMAGLVPAVMSEGARLRQRPGRQILLVGSLVIVAAMTSLILATMTRFVPLSAGTQILGDAWGGAVATVSGLALASALYAIVTSIVILGTVRGRADKAFALRFLGTAPIPVVLALVSTMDARSAAHLWALGSGIGVILVLAASGPRILREIRE